MTNKIITDKQIAQTIATLEKYINLSIADANVVFATLNSLPNADEEKQLDN